MAYVPEPTDSFTPEALGLWVMRELERVSIAIAALELGHLDKVFVVPVKPRDGDIRYADGTSWNPGGGAGIYWFNGTVWTKL